MLPIHARLALIALLLYTVAPLTAAPQTKDSHGDPLPVGALARLGTTRLRHADGICQVACSSDGKWLVSLSRDRTCRLWEAGTGRLHHHFTEKDLDFYSVAFSPDNATVAIAAGDPFHGGNTGIRLLDVRTGKVLSRFEGHHQPAYNVSFSPDGKTLLSVSCDQVIRWNTATGNKLSEWKLPTTAALSVSPDRTALAWVDGETEDKTIHLADAATGKEFKKLKNQHNEPSSRSRFHRTARRSLRAIPSSRSTSGTSRPAKSSANSSTKKAAWRSSFRRTATRWSAVA